MRLRYKHIVSITDSAVSGRAMKPIISNRIEVHITSTHGAVWYDKRPEYNTKRTMYVHSTIFHGIEDLDIVLPPEDGVRFFFEKSKLV